MPDSVERFSDRVDNYVKFRPSYPAEAIDCLIENTHIAGQATAADIGSGTGKFTELLLERGFSVYAVEPNANMRAAAEKALTSFSNFHSVNGSAEETSLSDDLVDVITVATAFHWFDRDKCKPEFQRILKCGGKTALVWNNYDKTGSPIMAEYEALIRPSHEESSKLARERVTGGMYDDFFVRYDRYYFTNGQRFDFDGLWGRAQSSSYSPNLGHPDYEKLKAALRELFEKYQQGGTIDFAYKTELIVGTI